MATVTAVVGTRTSLTVTSYSTLANGTYCASNAIDLTTNDPLDVLIEVNATPGTVSGNKQVVVFAQGSLDGTNFGTGPTSGTTTTDESVLQLVGVLPCPSNSTAQRKILSLAAAFGGVLPQQAKLVLKNETGAALSAGDVYYSEVTGSVA